MALHPSRCTDRQRFYSAAKRLVLADGDGSDVACLSPYGSHGDGACKPAAKSVVQGQTAIAVLPRHVQDVMAAADALLECEGARSLEALALPASWQSQLRQTVRYAALLHDLGKANHQFQRMVAGERSWPQAYRHEIISIWLVNTLPELQGWLYPCSNPNVRFIATAAVSATT